MLDRVRTPIRRWPLASLAVVAVVVATIAALAGTAGPQDHVRRLQHENATLTQQVANANAEASQASGELVRVQGQLDDARATLSLADWKRRKHDLEQQIADLSGQVSAEQAKLSTVKTQVAKSRIDDGTWQANVDFIPGTYQAPGGEDCYWAKLSGPSGEGIDNVIDNGGFNNHQVVSVDSPYFETRNCGTWHRVG